MLDLMDKRSYTLVDSLGVEHPLKKTYLRKKKVNQTQEIDYFKIIVGMARGGVFGADQSNFVNTFPLIKSMADLFLSSNSGNLCENPTRPLQTSLVDHARTSFAGLVGYGMATAHAEAIGASWFAHFEEAAKFSTILPPVGTKPNNKPDLIALSRNGVLSWIECKGGFGKNPDIWTEKVTKPYRAQIAPWIKGTVDGIAVNEGRVIGTHVSLSSTTLSSVYTNVPIPIVSMTAPLYPAAIILPHYSRWLNLFGSAMWDLKKQLSSRKKSTQTRSINIPMGQLYLGDRKFLLSLTQQPYCQTPCFEGQPIYLGIRSTILRSVIDLSLRGNSEGLTEGMFEEEIYDSDELLSYAREIGVENFCSFSDGTIAFTSGINFSAEARLERFEINFLEDNAEE